VKIIFKGESKLLTDNEIKSLNEDSLDFKAYAETLEEIIHTSETPLTIGIYGKWGSGKTSLMRISESLLKKREEIKTIWFDAWKFDKSHDLRVALIHNVLRSIHQDKKTETKIREMAGDLIKRVNWISLGKKVATTFLPLNLKSEDESILKKTEDISTKTLALIEDFDEEFKHLVRKYTEIPEFKKEIKDILPDVVFGFGIEVVESILSDLLILVNDYIDGTIDDFEGKLKELISRNQKKGKAETNDELKKQLSFDKKTIDTLIKEYKKISRKYNRDIRRIVVFIDDLDRCVPSKAIEVLEAIKLFLNVPHTIFIIGADRKIIEDGIHLKYGGRFTDWGENYLDKIIQIPVVLPFIKRETIIEKFIKELKITDEIKNYAKIIASVDSNPRKIKRLLNEFEFQQMLAEKRGIKIESEISAKLVVLRGKWRDFHTSLTQTYYETRKNLAEELLNISRLNPDEQRSRLETQQNLRKWIEDNNLMDFIKKEPSLADVKLDNYVYMIKSTTDIEDTDINYLSIAYSYGEKKEYEKSLEFYNKALELDPNNDEAWNNKGWILGELNRYEEALKCYEKAIEINPKYIYAWNNKGWILGTLNKHEEALLSFDRVIELNPKYVFSLSNKGWSLNSLNRFEEALKCLDEAVKIDPNYSNAWVNRGWSLNELKRYEEALNSFDRAIEIEPNNAITWRYKALTLNELHRHDEALTSIEKAINLDSDSVVSWEIKGNIMKSLGNSKAAKVCYQTAKDLKKFSRVNT